MPAVDHPKVVWNLLSEHSGTYLRRQRWKAGKSFKLCFLTYSDSRYRDKVADFLEARLHARVRVSIDAETTNSTSIASP